MSDSFVKKKRELTQPRLIQPIIQNENKNGTRPINTNPKLTPQQNRAQTRKRNLTTLGIMNTPDMTRKQIGKPTNIGVRTKKRQRMMMGTGFDQLRIWDNNNAYFTGDPKQLALAREQPFFIESSSGVGFHSNPYDPTSLSTRVQRGLLPVTVLEQDRFNHIPQLKPLEGVSELYNPIWSASGSNQSFMKPKPSEDENVRFPTETSLAPGGGHKTSLTPVSSALYGSRLGFVGGSWINPTIDPTDEKVYEQDALHPQTQERIMAQDSGPVSFTDAKLDHRNKFVGFASTVLQFAPQAMVLQDKKVHYQESVKPLVRSIGPEKSVPLSEMKDSVWGDQRLPKEKPEKSKVETGAIPEPIKQQVKKDDSDLSLYMYGLKPKAKTS